MAGSTALLGLAGLTGPTGCASAPATADKEPISTDESELRLSGNHYLGPIANGETKTSSYANPPRYRSYGFDAAEDDVVTLNVSSQNGDAVAWLTTSSYTVLATNDDASPQTLDAKIVYTVPYGTPTRSYRVVFRDYEQKDASFTVTLNIDSTCDPEKEPWRDYLGTPVTCQTLRFTCTPDKRTFQNACGCGCELLSH